MVGDWMGSTFDAAGRRYDYQLFLDIDGRYERVIRHDPGYERYDSGLWRFDEAEMTIGLCSEIPDEWGRNSGEWSVLSVTACEDSNVLFVLREVALASRNLPILFYQVHCNGRAYGSGWQERLSKQSS
jgi:hypothetical protein